MSRDKWKLVTDYGVLQYKCGLSAGDILRLKREIVVRNTSGQPTGEIHAACGLWHVLNGSAEDPGTVWLRQPDGERHTWNDEPSIFEWFERVQ